MQNRVGGIYFMSTHNRHRLGSGTSLFVALCLSPSLACAQTTAKPSPPAPTEEDADAAEIVVTGTILRGVAPVGSSIISLNANDIQKTGLLSTTDVLKSIPQVTGIGTGEATTVTTQNSNLNISRANGLNIRGLGIQATLTLFQGRRVPTGGFGAQLFDPSTIPAIALSRIDVVADGASATYGSDAVAGVANLILRSDVEGVEMRGRYGFADNYHAQAVSALAGHKWDTGRAMVAAEYSWNDQLLQSDRPQYFSCNQLASGGTNNCVFGGAPGNIVFGTTRFGLPAGTGVGVTEAQLLATPNRLESYVYTTAIPANKRFNFVGSFRQEIGNNIELWTEGFYYHRTGNYYVGSPATGSNAAIPATIAVPSTNPNFVRIAGRSTTSQNVEYSIFNDIGDGRPAESTEYGHQLAAGVDFKLGDNWRLSSYYANNGNFAEVYRSKEINTVLLTTALACTTSVCLNPYGSGGNSGNAAALATLLGFTRFLAYFKSDILNAQVDGTLATIGGGDIKLAVGGQYLKESFSGVNTSNSGAGPTSLTDVRITANFGKSRTIKSAFAETIVPLFGDGNGVPGLQKLELNLAIRHDKYSDAGATTNPKFGIKWEPMNGLTFRGSYGKSFRAPTLIDGDPFSTPSLSPSTVLAGAGRNVLTLLGGNPTVKPEKATTWSTGLEFKPEGLRGLSLSLNYFDIDYRNVIDTPGNSGAVFTDPALASYAIINPTVQQINDLIVAPINAGLYRAVTAFQLFTPTGGSNVYAIVDGRKNNAPSVQMRGLDMQLGYQFESGVGNWNLGINATKVFSYKFAAYPGAPVVERVNNANFPVKFKARGQIGLSTGGFGINTFFNYTNSYRVVALVPTGQFTPALTAPQNERVKSNMTVDATVSYTVPKESGMLGGLSFAISAQNLFDRAPPFARTSGSQEYDSANASALGRMISFEIRKKF
jgi:iron complex outermembrane recepter protein